MAITIKEFVGYDLKNETKKVSEKDKKISSKTKNKLKSKATKENIK